MSPAFMNFLIGFPSNSPSTSSMGILVPISYALSRHHSDLPMGPLLGTCIHAAAPMQLKYCVPGTFLCVFCIFTQGISSGAILFHFTRDSKLFLRSFSLPGLC